MQKWILSALLLAPGASYACAKFFQSFNVPGTPFEKSKITFAENEFGPQIDGWTFKVNNQRAVGIFFGGRKKTWCGVVQDKKEGINLDCSYFSNKQAGTTTNPIWVFDSKDKSGKPKAFALHGDDHTLTIYTLDPAKPVKTKDPMGSIDPAKPEIILKGFVDVDDKNEAQAKMEVIVWDVAANKSSGRAALTIEGAYAENGQIKRPQVRQAGPPPPIKPLQTFNLVGSMYTGPGTCGFGELGAYTPPKDEGQTRVPAKTN